jgi:leucyl aminopeptidase
MKFSVSDTYPTAERANRARILSADRLGELPEALRKECEAQLATASGRPVVVASLGTLADRWVVALPEMESADPVRCRRTGGRIGYQLSERGIVDAVLEVTLADERLTVLLEGLSQGAYRFVAYQPGTSPLKHKVVVRRAQQAVRQLKAAVKPTRTVVEAVDRCRDWINTPAADLGPDSFAAECKKLAKQAGLGFRELDEEACRAAGMGGLLAVGAASPRRPRLVVLDWPGSASSAGKAGRGTSKKGRKTAAAQWALIGKGITFDTGGVQIKPGKGMELMRKDMGGAATVVAAMIALAGTKSPFPVRAYLPLADNAIDGNAYRPGDILTMADGTTVEVGHTDAEGRLVMADAMVQARNDGCIGLTTVATLTGAALVALGRIHVPIMGTDQSAIDCLRAAAEASGEKTWQLPLDDDHRAIMRGQSAQLTNSGNGEAGCITAGAFLAHSAAEVLFVHADISPASWQTSAHDLGPAGATGVFVSTLVRWLSQNPQGG